MSIFEKLNSMCSLRENHNLLERGGRCSECGYIHAEIASEDYRIAVAKAMREKVDEPLPKNLGD